MSIQTGDTVTIRRGKNAGQSGKVISVNSSEAVLEMPDGKFSVQAVTNVKAPEQPTITADDLADIMSRNVNSDGSLSVELIDALDDVLPGFRKAYDNASN